MPHFEQRTLFVLIGRVPDIISMPAQRKVSSERVHKDIKQFCTSRSVNAKGSQVAQRTHLKVLVVAPQEHLRRSTQRIPRIPPREARLPERGVHHMLHAPHVVPSTVRRELLPYDARVWPGPGACACGCALGRCEEIDLLRWREEPLDDDVAVRLVVLFD
jgi:hypothetical protein